MPKANKGRGKVGLKPGYVTDLDTGDTFGTLQDAMKKDADCGCGIDCCNNELKLIDKTTGTAGAFYFDNGALKFRNAAGATFTVTIVAD